MHLGSSRQIILILFLINILAIVISINMSIILRLIGLL